MRRIVLTCLIAIGLVAPAGAATHQFYKQQNLVHGGAAAKDPNLINPWGISFGPGTFIWISDNNGGVSTLYTATGQKQSLVVTIPGPGGTGKGAPTGTVFNPNNSLSMTPEFGGAIFMFVTEGGTIAAWDLPDNTLATTAVDNSASGAVYKGMTLGHNATGDKLYATNFGNGTVEVYDTSFHRVTVSGGFADATIPAGFWPFGIQNIEGNIWVTYALPDGTGDEMNAPGNGFVDEFDSDGKLLMRLAPKGQLNSPWGLALAPANFGPLSNMLLVGNFGDGKINAYDPGTGAFVNVVRGRGGKPVVNPGLWALVFADGSVGATDELFFTAGGKKQNKGLFGDFTVGTATGGGMGGGGYGGMGMSAIGN